MTLDESEVRSLLGSHPVTDEELAAMTRAKRDHRADDLRIRANQAFAEQFRHITLGQLAYLEAFLGEPSLDHAGPAA